MSLFQTSVVKKYLNELSSEQIDKKYKEFQVYFGNPEIQQNIRDSKEEEYQSGFVRALFVNILGYTLKPEPNFNFVLEKKNVDDSKKADGAILKDNEVIAVIELKSTQTTDLDTIETQAFGYKNHNPKCQYIITSNFEKIRLYIQNAIDHLEFDLFNLTKEDFALLWLCFVKDNILQDIPLKIKESSVLQEENVTKKLYNDYSKFRTEIFENIVKNNPDFDKLVLFKKTQKLLDRFLFIFFAEDRLLLPPNSISEIVKQWTTLKEDLDEYVPLYDRFKKYFGYIDKGFKGKKYDIFAYNGGLFLPDEILDNIKIDDEVLHQNTVKLSTYDFETEVDVNILGHIFENSLSEIENFQAEIAGKEIDKQKTKRKKDGIFYTPKYITKYIVENTVGKLCEEKRNQLGIVNEEYAKGRKNRKKDIVRALDEKLTQYRDWLLEITILDPACGSGAFLNQSLEFLLQEHKKIDELKFQLLGGSIVFPDIEARILESNIYGVDLNEESIEIAKLSLWLRTAQKGRKLTTLSNHIKCGNSLIDDTEVVGEKAFNWQNEFPEVFEKGGFDIVIGNPPYVQLQKMENVSPLLKQIGYKTFESTGDLYCLFYEKGWQVLKEKGLLGYITSNKWMRANYGKSIRKFFYEYTAPYKLLDLGTGVFEAATVDSNILLFEKTKTENFSIPSLDISKEKDLQDFSFYENCFVQITPKNDEIWTISSQAEQHLKDKIENLGIPLKDWDIEIYRGITTGYNDAFVVNEETKKELINKHPSSVEVLKPILKGRDISKYFANYDNLWLLYIPWNFPNTFSEKKYTFEENEMTLSQNFPAVYEHLLSHKIGLLNRNKAETNIRYEWYVLQRWAANYYEEFDKEKIIYQEMVQESSFSYHEKGTMFCLDTGRIITGESLKYILCVLNTKLFFYAVKNIYGGGGLGEKGVRMKHTFFENFPLIKANEKPYEEKADIMIDLNKRFHFILNKFTTYLQTQFIIESLPKKLQNWHEIEFKEFINELNKLIIKTGNEKLSKMDEMEWMEVFESKKEEILNIKSEIDKTDKEINQMVYELYNLSKEEIKIVEESI